MTILGIISAVAVSSYRGYQQQVKLAQLMSQFSRYAEQIQIFYEQRGVLPTATQLDANADPSWGNGYTLLGNGNNYSHVANPDLATQLAINNLIYVPYDDGTFVDADGVYALTANPDGSWELSTDPQFFGIIYMGGKNANGVWIHACAVNDPNTFGDFPPHCRQTINHFTIDTFPDVLN